MNDLVMCYNNADIINPRFFQTFYEKYTFVVYFMTFSLYYKRIIYKENTIVLYTFRKQLFKQN